MDDNTYSVYMHKNLVNGKVYIGLTGNKPEKRWNSGRGYKGTSHFNHAINKYGWDNFSHEIIEFGLSKSLAAELETKLIAEYDSTNPEKGYNMSSGGEIGALGVKQSEEVKERRRKSAKKAWEDETLRKEQSKRLKGIKRSKETREKIRKASLGRIIPSEQRKSISKTLRLYNVNNPDSQKKNIEYHSKPVMCIETGKMYESAKTAAMFESVSSSMIGKCCRNEIETAKGKHFKFVPKQANTEVNEISKEVSSP